MIDNPNAIHCPHCHRVLCARCELYEVACAAGNYCGCADCHKTLRRRQRAYRTHRREVHGDEGGAP